MSSELRGPGFQVRIGSDPPTELYAERLRDGRVALGTRVQEPDGSWTPGELQLLPAAAALDLSAWLAPLVEQTWMDTIRGRSAEPLRTAKELYGEGEQAVERLAHEMLAEIPAALLARALALLVNSMGPESRERLVSRLNTTGDVSEDSMLRRQMAEESAAVAYGVAAAALFDVLAREEE